MVKSLSLDPNRPSMVVCMRLVAYGSNLFRRTLKLNLTQNSTKRSNNVMIWKLFISIQLFFGNIKKDHNYFINENMWMYMRIKLLPPSTHYGSRCPSPPVIVDLWPISHFLIIYQNNYIAQEIYQLFLNISYIHFL